MTEEHRITEELNYVLAGCFMQRKEREEMCEIFQPLIENLVVGAVYIQSLTHVFVFHGRNLDDYSLITSALHVITSQVSTPAH